MTGMIDAAFRDFGSPSDESVMVGDDWEGADSGIAENAEVFTSSVCCLSLT